MDIDNLTIKDIKEKLSNKKEEQEKRELQQMEEIKDKILFYSYDQYIDGGSIEKINEYYFLTFTKKRRSQSKKHKGQIMTDLYIYYKGKNISKILQTMEGCHYSNQKITIVKKLIDHQKIVKYIES